MLRPLAVTLVATASLVSACGGPIYELPSPPPAEQQRAVSLSPTEQRELDATRFLAARATILSLYEALGNEEWDSAQSLLSQETCATLGGGSGSNCASVLAEGLVEVSGTRYAFDPVDLLLLPGVRDIANVRVGEEDVENARRVVAHLTDRDEDHRAVVLIYEGDQWVVHSPTLPVGALDVVRD
ncbi:MAG: hypothetical protein ACI81R_000858 [Bradymonadia bacterium]|jgi:hypothetical protein